MQANFLKLGSLFFLLLLLHSCRQLLEINRLSECEFELASLSKINMATIDFEKINTISDLGFLDAAKVTKALASDNFPMEFTANLNATNPNSKMAAINQIEWIAYIDDMEIAQGVLNERVEVPGNNGSAIIPIKINCNLKKVFSSRSIVSLTKMAINFSGLAETPTRVKIKVKPNIKVGKKLLQYPGYISVTQIY